MTRPLEAKRFFEDKFQIIALIFFLLLSPSAWAQAPDLGQLNRNNPRATVKGFLEAARAGDFKLASEYLDLAPLKGEASHDGSRRAHKLKVVLDRQLWIDLTSLSDKITGEKDDGLPVNRERVGSINLNGRQVEILLSRNSSRGSTPVWQFSASTVALTPRMYEQYGDGPIASLLPQPLTALTFLEIKLWQWMGVILFLVLSFATGWLIAFALVQLVRPLVRKSQSSLDDQLLSIVTQPIRLLITTGIFSLSLGWLYLSVPAEKALKRR